MKSLLESKAEAIGKISTLDCDLLEVSRMIGRESAFSASVYHIFNDLSVLKPNQQVLINNEKLIHFLNAAYAGYRRDVEYHNDLHGADVA